ncbi:uncharacterized protein LOC105026845 [Esox lucius]|uniref:uncharacterized protein LOC105026845 n=1 Tax=Esox lucius TaxID=8010 RepID=UPI001477398A|nr:uncharacterized protein LOC105026845 [Esox lucius]
MDGPPAAVGAEDAYNRWLTTAPQLRARPLSLFYSEWRRLCTLSGWLEVTLRKGYALQFHCQPPPFSGIVETVMSSPAKVAALQGEIADLLEKGAVSLVPLGQRERGFYSPYFLVPKKTGGMRPILDLRVLNNCVSKRPFRMLTTKRLMECVHPGDFCVSIDLKDAYFHVPVLPRHRKFLRFAFQGQAYEYTRIPFGYALAPRTFTKCVEAALGPLRGQGVRVLAYLDDLLVLAHSAEQARIHTFRLVSQLTRLGFAVNWGKSAPQPCRLVVFLGLQLSTVSMRARVSEARRETILRALAHVQPSHMVSVHAIMSLLGLMSSAHAVVPLGMLHMRGLQRWFARQRLDPVRHRRRLVRVPDSLGRDLAFWGDPRTLLRGVPMGRVSVRVPVFTDASLTGWGGTCQSRSVRGVWPPLERHINWLELDTIRRVLLHFAPALRGRDVLVWSDNRTAVAYVNRQGGVRSLPLHLLAVQIWEWAHMHLRSLRALHIPGELNVGADLLSRGGPRDDEWRLHPDIVAELWRRFGRAQVDLFASREDAHCPLWYSLRARDRPPLGVDALAHRPWPRALLYAFPPLQCILPVMSRVRSEGLSLILIAPFRPGALWFAEAAQMAVGTPWPIPHRHGALSQANGSIGAFPVLGQPLRAWLLRGPDCDSLFEQKRSPGTLKVYACAVSACHEGFNGVSVFSHPLVKRFLAWSRRLRPVVRRTLPQWDLALVLEALCDTPFEPIDQIPLKPGCLTINGDGSRAVLLPNPAFLPKVIKALFRSMKMVLWAFSPPPHASEREERLHRLCPVRALAQYVLRTAAVRAAPQLCVCHGGPKVGQPLSKQRLSHWLCEAIDLAYSSRGVPTPIGFGAHSTRGVAASAALFKGVGVEDICAAASWGTPSPFVRFYLRDMATGTLAHSVLSVAESVV